MTSRWLALVVMWSAGCGDDTLAIPFQDARPTDGDVEDMGIDAPPCEAQTGPGTMHSTGISAPETWTAAGSPHIVMNDTSVNAAITVEECAVVKIADDKFLSVRANGSLTAVGREGRPVRFERLDPASSWASISALNGGTISLTHVIIDGGGDPLNAVTAGALDIAALTPSATPILHTAHVEVTSSESNGLFLHDGGGFSTDSVDLTVTGSAGAPLNIWPRSAGTIPPGRYSGNGLDRIVLNTNGIGAVRENVTISPHGVRYRVGDGTGGILNVASLVSGQVATLTIEPGVIIELTSGGRMTVEPSTGVSMASGRLIAMGTVDAPIVFTSAAATPAAGDWFGVWFGQSPVSRLDHVRVEYAGRFPSGSQLDSCLPGGQVGPNDAAIRILGPPVDAAPFITNTTIVSSGRHGIDRAWQQDNPPDYTATNTFVDIVGCPQTQNETMNGTCPVTSSCP